MTASYLHFTLAAVIAISLLLSAINFFSWQIKREDRTPLWLSAWLIFTALFSLCRLLQYASLSEQAYLVLPRILLTAAYMLAWLGYEVANQFVRCQPPRWERSLFVGSVSLLIVLLWTGNLILTDQIMIRNIVYGGPFHGVLAGPLYIPATLLLLAITVIAPVRLLKASTPNKAENRLMAAGYIFFILFSLVDFFATANNLNWIRLSDYSYLPMAIFFTYIQIQQIGKMYVELDDRVQERTTELTRINESLRASEEQAQLSQHRLMGLVDSAMDAVVSINREHRIVLFNPAAEKMFGYSAGEILGQPLNLILPGRFHAHHTQQIDQFAKTGISARNMQGYVEVKGIKKDQEEFTLEASISQVEVGGERLFTAILRDTSERKRAEVALRESEEKYRTLVENANSGITIIQNGRVRYVNPQLAEMRGESIDAILGQRFDKYIHPDEKGRIIKHYRRRITGKSEPMVYETLLLRSDNIAVPVELASGFIAYQGQPAEIIIIHDIQERKLAEQALQRQLLEMSVLNVVTTAGAEALDVDQLFGRVTDAIGNFLYPDNFGILVADHVTKTYKPHFSYKGISAERLESSYLFSEGIAGNVISNARLIRVDDIRDKSDYMEVTASVQSEVAAPIMVSGKVYGCINAESIKPAAFTEHDERFMSTVADSLATAIEKIQLIQTEKRRREEAEILFNTTHDLIIERDLSKLLQIIVERAVGMVGAPSGGLYLCDPKQRQVRCVVSYNTLRDYVGTVLNYGEGAAGTVAETGEPLVIEDYRYWKARATIYEDEQPFRSVLCVPLLWQESVIGVIHILENTRPRSFTNEDLQIAKHFANQAAIAVENARLFEKEQQRRREAELLRESFLSLTYSMEPENLFEVILDTLQKLIPYDSASIELVDGDYLMIVAGSNLPVQIVGTRYVNFVEKWGHLEHLRDPLIINNVQEDDRFVKIDGTGYIRGWMGIPLFARDKLIGYLNLDSRTEGFYTENHQAIAQIFGSQAAIALENMLLFQETVEHADKASAIAEIGRDISGTLQLDAILEKISAYATNLLRADTSAVYLYREGNQSLQATIAMGLDSEFLKQQPIIPGQGILGSIVMQKVGEIVNNTFDDPRGVTVDGTEETLHEHLMGVPVLSEDRLIGLIAVWRVGEGKEFKPTDLGFLENLAQQVAVAIENARLFDREQKRRQEADTLLEAAQKITSTLNQEQAIQWILDQLAKVVEFRSASVQLLREGYLELVGGRGWLNTSDVLGTHFPVPGDNPNSTVVSERRAVILENAPQTYKLFNSPPHDHIKSWLGVPLIVRDRVIGMFAIDHDQACFYTDDDARLVSAFASQAAIAIENARLFEEQERRLGEIETVHKVSTALRSAEKLDEALPILLDQLMHLLNANGASLEMMDPSSGETVTELAYGAWAHVTGLRTPAGWGISSHVIATGEPYVSSDVATDGKAQQFNLFGGLNAVACVPVIARDEPIGALWIGRQSRIRPEEVSLFAAIGEMVGNAIHRMRLNEQTIRRADEFEALFSTAHGLTSQWELQSLLEIVVVQAMGLLDSAGGGIYLYNAKDNELEVVVGKGPAMVIGTRLKRGEGMAGRVLENRLHLIVDDYRRWEGRSSKYGDIPIGAVIEVPIIFAGDFIGVLVVYENEDSKRVYTEAEARLLSLFASQAASAIRTARLLEELQTSNLELEKAYDTTLAGWARALELRDKETHGHSRRVTNLTLRLARLMEISSQQLIHIRRGVLLHDIGKMGIPDDLLRKPGVLNEEDWIKMRKHPQYAYDLLEPIIYLRPALDIPYCHHEKWDGSGYPRGLSGEQIPLAARVFAVVDVYDALSFDRPYREAWPQEKVLDYLQEQSGRHFDPQVVDAFLTLIKGNDLDDEDHL